MAKKFFIETFGCQMNELDSEKIAGSLRCEGMEPTGDASQADLVILNTCSIREKAVQKVYARLGEIKKHKKRQNELMIGVVGCMAQLEGEQILSRAPFVNIIAGPQKGTSDAGAGRSCGPDPIACDRSAHGRGSRAVGNHPHP